MTKAEEQAGSPSLRQNGEGDRERGSAADELRQVPPAERAAEGERSSSRFVSRAACNLLRADRPFSARCVTCEKRVNASALRRGGQTREVDPGRIRRRATASATLDRPFSHACENTRVLTRVDGPSFAETPR